MSNRAKIITLWIVFLFGLTFHTLFAVIPIFWGEGIAMSQEMIEKNPIAPMMWMMLFFFLVPMIIVVVTAFVERKWYRITNFVFSLVFTPFNIFHIVEHCGETPVDGRQIVLLLFVLISGVFLNIVSFRWIKE
ncbi:hypothetical protein KAW50_07535 [candidate division WOR-3 bacterium]|nr:hypothetical protein [candidate division WOR-3 bacterium]